MGREKSDWLLCLEERALERQRKGLFEICPTTSHNLRVCHRFFNWSFHVHYLLDCLPNKMKKKRGGCIEEEEERFYFKGKAFEEFEEFEIKKKLNS